MEQDTIDRKKLAYAAAGALCLLMVQAAVMRLSPMSLPLRIVLPATVALTPAALWPLRRYAGTWVIFVGLTANLAAILANGGLMPIEERTVVAAVGAERAANYEPGHWLRGSKDVLVAPGQGRLVALGDAIIIRTGSGGFAASAGDLVIWCGVIVLAAQASVAWQRRRRANALAAAPALQLARITRATSHLRSRGASDEGKPAEGGAATPP